MKKVIKNIELQKKMEKAIHLLCDTVKTTLGPVGNNIIIDHSTFTPFITNDGVTIAKNIESEDPIINTILELAKESSIKTDETVGDGTTTTLVLLEEIFDKGLELIKNGKNSIILKNEINEALNSIIPLIKEKSYKPSKNELINIASISANDNQIGKTIGKAYFKTKQKNAIKLTDNINNKTKLYFYKGYSFDTNIASNYYFNKQTQIKLNSSKILLVDNYVDSPEDIALFLNYIMEKQENLVIVANDYSENFINQIISLYLDNNIKIFLLKNPEYGGNQRTFLNDLSIISNSEILQNFEINNFKHLGNISNIVISKEKTTISFNSSDKIKNHIKQIKLELKHANDFNKEFHYKRLAMFQSGLAEIKIGGNTNTEIREKHMRYEDALCAIDSASKGILPGAGIIFLQINNNFTPTTDGEKIVIKSLEKPFIQILENAGINKLNILTEIKKYNFQKLYNITTNEFEDIKKTSVLDPTEVLINCLTNACSIASMLLTTTNLIINEYQNNLDKQNEYNEL